MLPRLLHTASKFALFSVSGLKDKEVDKKINLNEVVKIDPYIFELYRFKVGSFFDRCWSTRAQILPQRYILSPFWVT